MNNKTINLFSLIKAFGSWINMLYNLKIRWFPRTCLFEKDYIKNNFGMTSNFFF